MILQIQNTIGDLVEPASIPFGFGAPGWTVLLVLIIISLLGIIIFQWQKYRKNKYRRDAVAELLNIDYNSDKPDNIIYKNIHVLKRVSLTSFDRSSVATLNGTQFYNFMQEQTHVVAFSEESQKVFTKYMYQGEKCTATNSLLMQFRDESIHWIKKHYV